MESDYWMKIIKKAYWMLRRHFPFNVVYRYLLDPLKTRLNLCLNLRKQGRKLEIGCSGDRLLGFETLSIMGGPRIDYVLDAAKKLPFADASFDLVYASHVLEHIPWFMVKKSLAEWTRILKHGGALEIWVPDGGKISQVLLDLEEGRSNSIPDDWFPLNSERDPYLWVSGRLFWGANPLYPSWHHSLFTAGYLKKLLLQEGLCDVRVMETAEVRGCDHGWINLGVKGCKP